LQQPRKQQQKLQGGHPAFPFAWCTRPEKLEGQKQQQLEQHPHLRMPPYRPAAAWIGVVTMAVHGVALPLLPVFGAAPVAIDWVGLSAFLGVVFGPLIVARTVEKIQGVTS
jgi:hypothetical protein